MARVVGNPHLPQLDWPNKLIVELYVAQLCFSKWIIVVPFRGVKAWGKHGNGGKCSVTSHALRCTDRELARQTPSPNNLS